MSHSLPSSLNPPGSISGDFLDQIGQLICGYVTKRGWFILKDFSETGSKKSFEKKRVGFKDGGERGHDRRQDQEPWRGVQKKGWRRESAPVGAYPDGGHWGVPGDPTPPPALTASLPRGPWSCFLNHIERTIVFQTPTGQSAHGVVGVIPRPRSQFSRPRGNRSMYLNAAKGEPGG